MTAQEQIEILQAFSKVNASLIAVCKSAGDLAECVKLINDRLSRLEDWANRTHSRNPMPTHMYESTGDSPRPETDEQYNQGDHA